MKLDGLLWDKRSGQPGSSTNICEESLGQVCPPIQSLQVIQVIQSAKSLIRRTLRNPVLGAESPLRIHVTPTSIRDIRGIHQRVIRPRRTPRLTASVRLVAPSLA